MKPKLLIVDDNELTMTLLSTIFSSLGFEIVEIDRGDGVLPYLATNKVNIIILDLELPGMTGDQIYAGLKSDPALSFIPVVPFTAHQSTESEDSLSRRLMRVSVRKTGGIPPIVFKNSDEEEKSNITKEIVDEVARNLLMSGVSLPPETIEHYKTVYGIQPNDLKSTLMKSSRQTPVSESNED